MPEPTMTLGLLFRRHVAGWVMDTVPTPPPGELEALCARADAAERLAVAVDTAAGDREVNDWSYDARRLDEYNNALAAWRALGEVDG